MESSQRGKVLPDLSVQGFGRGAKQWSGGGVEPFNGRWAVVRFQKEAVGRTSLKAGDVVAETEADIETVGQKLTQLLGLAAEAVEHPRLTGAPFQTQHVVRRTDTMQDEWSLQLFAQPDLCLEGCKLPLVRGVAEAVETTFADEEEFALSLILQQPGLPPVHCIQPPLQLTNLLLPRLGEVPGMQPEGRERLLTFASRMMCVNIQVVQCHSFFFRCHYAKVRLSPEPAKLL